LNHSYKIPVVQSQVAAVVLQENVFTKKKLTDPQKNRHYADWSAMHSKPDKA